MKLTSRPLTELRPWGGLDVTKITLLLNFRPAGADLMCDQLRRSYILGAMKDKKYPKPPCRCAYGVGRGDMLIEM